MLTFHSETTRYFVCDGRIVYEIKISFISKQVHSLDFKKDRYAISKLLNDIDIKPSSFWKVMRLEQWPSAGIFIAFHGHHDH